MQDDMTKEIELVKKEIYDDEWSGQFSKFCISAGATKIFDTLVLSLVLGTQKIAYALKKKVASYIYNFCNPLQENHALYLRSNHKNQDGIKTELKSKGDFDTAYDVAMCPLKKLIVFQPRDWPCQFYYGQIIYESPKKFISSYPGWSDTPPQQEHILTGLSSYCYSMTYGITRNLSKNNLPQETSQTFILSIVPTIGPLNIS